MKDTTSYEIRSSRDSVEFWSASRMPFERKGVMLEARHALREALRTLQLRPDHWLTCAYVSSISAFVDVENILFYNVGMSVFSDLMMHGVRAVRSFEAPPMSPAGHQFSHFQCYTVGPVPTITESGALLTFPLSAPTAIVKPHDVWWSASTGHFEGTVSTTRYALEVEVPVSVARKLAANMKPLLDGIISAMHPVRDMDELAVERLSNTTGWGTAEIMRRLREPVAPILGTRTVLRSYRRFVRWDPADDLCDSFALHPSGTANTCRVWVGRSEWPSGSKSAGVLPGKPNRFVGAVPLGNQGPEHIS